MRRTTTLAPITVTSRSPRALGGDGARLTEDAEVWAAVTTDGAWELVREEIAGTPWVALRTADKRRGGTYGTLRAARAAIASGAAGREANRCQACEGTGDHYEERVGRAHADGHYGWRQIGAGEIAYRHLVGACPCCAGTGREPGAASSVLAA